MQKENNLKKVPNSVIKACKFGKFYMMCDNCRMNKVWTTITTNDFTHLIKVDGIKYDNYLSLTCTDPALPEHILMILTTREEEMRNRQRYQMICKECKHQLGYFLDFGAGLRPIFDKSSICFSNFIIFVNCYQWESDYILNRKFISWESISMSHPDVFIQKRYNINDSRDVAEPIKSYKLHTIFVGDLHTSDDIIFTFKEGYYASKIMNDHTPAPGRFKFSYRKSHSSSHKPNHNTRQTFVYNHFSSLSNLL